VRPWIAVLVSFKGCAAALAATHHPVAAAVMFFAPDPWLVMQFVLPSQQAFGPAVTAFKTDRREVWLTIDDGPDPASTPEILRLLRAHDARATFFVVGAQVAKYPELARRIVAEGHGIGNHTQTHPATSFWSATPARIAEEIDGCVGALLLADAPFERYFRPPVGIRNPFLDPQLFSRGMEMILWNARGLDGGGRHPDAALARIARRIRPGAILLAHEAGPRAKGRVQFVEKLLDHLEDQDYACIIPSREAFVCGG
jgi:peptidoglycan/xylan/chitin deacetylase (PgdA/CDA1 family)